ncbi:hypothetical protein CKO25_19645 [Thiocapsa imhoffii]|uniref:Uncharacterized protein n=1 Tax=Thiocapsa imhoffii TaxID=382777 RepID=A0A9X0WLP1_9GAMM|nr:TIGR04255 family protein [Thiocapsa imhoffii]MBK1646811.1 hypothetical protein [Thiocapsa imhoffii]
MMNEKLPRRLHKEPIIDALFECRFLAHLPLSSILPGVIFSDLKGEKKLERLPHAEIPEVIRNNDPNLQYIPLIRIRLADYSLMIGDRSMAVACNLPYQGWPHFKSMILSMMEILKQASLVDGLTRYSLKYVDLIESKDPADQVSLETV